MSITLEFDNAAASETIKQYSAKLGDPAPLLRDIGEYLVIAHLQRFKDQQSPDGSPWAPLTPRYKKIKRKNADRILFLNGYLATTLHPQINNDELLFGSDRKYAALHHFGGEVKRKARTQDLFFKRNGDGTVGNKFVKKKISDVTKTVNVNAHTIKYTARPWLGTSTSDNNEIVAITQRYLANIKTPRITR